MITAGYTKKDNGNTAMPVKGAHRSRASIAPMNSRAACSDPMFRVEGYCAVSPCPQHAPAQYTVIGARHRLDPMGA